MKQKGQLTSDDYEMVDYMLNQFKTVIGVNGNSKKKEKKGGEQNKDTSAEKGTKKTTGRRPRISKSVLVTNVSCAENTHGYKGKSCAHFQDTNDI